MKASQRFMLKRPLLSRINFEFIPLLRPQSRMNEKPKWTRGKLLESAHRGAQHRAIQPPRELCVESGGTFRSEKALDLLEPPCHCRQLVPYQPQSLVHLAVLPGASA